MLKTLTVYQQEKSFCSGLMREIGKRTIPEHREMLLFLFLKTVKLQSYHALVFFLDTFKVIFLAIFQLLR